MRATTKTIIGSVSTLMFIGMTVSLLSSSDTYYVGRIKVGESSIARELPRQFASASVLMSDGDIASTSMETKNEEEQSEEEQVPRTVSMKKNNIAKQPTPLIKRKRVHMTETKNIPEVPINASKPTIMPVSCEEQKMYTYRGPDTEKILYGSCIPCIPNKFNVQSNMCTQ